MALLQLNEVSVAFTGGDGQSIPALKGITAEVMEGDFISIIGANGSGKSTLFNALAGTVPLSEGSLLLDGKAMQSQAAHHRAQWLGRVFQNPLQGTAPDLTVADNFRLAGLRGKHKMPWFAGGSERQSKAVIAALGLGLEAKWKQPMGSLSGGQRQTLTVLMATLAPARLLLLDEPVAALDPASGRMVMETAARVAKEQGLTVLHITHKLSDALGYGNRLWVMKQGRLEADLSPQEKAQMTVAQLEADYFARN